MCPTRRRRWRRSGRIADIIAAARMERLKLPRADDDEEDEDILALPAPVPTLGDGNEEEAEEAEAMEVDAETTGGWRAAAFRVNVERTKISRTASKNAPRPSDRERLDHELRDAVERRRRTSPVWSRHGQARAQYEGLKEKEAEQVEALEDCRRKTKEANEAFDAIMQERANRRSWPPSSTSPAPIDRGTRSHLVQGSIRWAARRRNLEDIEERVNSGREVQRHAPPRSGSGTWTSSAAARRPWRRLRSSSRSSCRSSPFFILDEVDAALDKTNVEKMAQFIRNRSHGTNPGREGKPCQSIVISLKDYFFDKADSLVGVCRDIDQACSRVLTFDLEKYPERNRGVTRKQRDDVGHGREH